MEAAGWGQDAASSAVRRNRFLSSTVGSTVAILLERLRNVDAASGGVMLPNHQLLNLQDVLGDANFVQHAVIVPEHNESLG